MRIAIIGSGGREHALVWKLSQSGEKHEFFVMPGNGGTEIIAQNIAVDILNTRELVEVISKLSPDFVIVGPETPLANGIIDLLNVKSIPCFGPSKAAAQIEASKVFAKELMKSIDIPTANFEVFEEFDKLKSFVTQSKISEWVVKADGLAAGKGVIVCQNKDETIEAAFEILSKRIFGSAGQKVVLEQRLYGREASAHFFCDGETCINLPAAQDYKRSFDSDLGANTGGMGTFSPANHLSPSLLSIVEQTIVKPLLQELLFCGFPYRGVLYVGLMLTDSGPKVIEFNCRFGDPETQVMLPIWNGNLLQTMVDCSAGKLKTFDPSLNKSAVCVVLAAEGYPEHYKRDIPLRVIRDTDSMITFHAGTKIVDGKLMSNGGRVLNAVGVGSSLQLARSNAYALAEQLCVDGLRYRKDIAAS